MCDFDAYTHQFNGTCVRRRLEKNETRKKSTHRREHDMMKIEKDFFLYSIHSQIEDYKNSLNIDK
jgi:hypothetical protein